jgi:hypothetical protein
MHDNKDPMEGRSPSPWIAAPQYNYAVAGYTSNVYPSPAQSPPPPPVFAELSQEAQRPVPELGSDGPIHRSYKRSVRGDEMSTSGAIKAQQQSPVEMDAEEQGNQVHDPPS